MWGDNWEGGRRDADGREWEHIPWQGWRLRPPSPFLARGTPPRRTRRQRLGRPLCRAAGRWALPLLVGTLVALGGLAAMLAGVAGLFGVALLAALFVGLMLTR